MEGRYSSCHEEMDVKTATKNIRTIRYYSETYNECLELA